MSTHDTLHVHEEMIHRNGGSCRLILPLLIGDVVMRPVPIMQRVVSERHVCRFVIFPLCLRRSVSRSCSHTPVWRCQLSFAFTFVSCFCLLLLQLSSVLLLQPLQHFFCVFSPTQCCRPYKLVESGLTTHCPCQLKTGPVFFPGKSTCPSCTLHCSRLA